MTHGRSSGIRTHGLLLPRQARYQAALCSAGVPGEIRTPDPLIRSQVLYPAELRAHPNSKIAGITVAGEEGIEPSNDGVKVRCLTAWRLPNGKYGVSNGDRTHECRSHRPVR